MDRPASSLLWVSLSSHFTILISYRTKCDVFSLSPVLLFVLQINVFFFLITVWKLAQKFASLNPDLDKLQKIKWATPDATASSYCRVRSLSSLTAFLRVSAATCRTFTITAVAQLCVLGLTWIFGCFQFDDRTMIMSYLFTISGSLQGVMMFVFHCLFSKQVGHCDKCAFPAQTFAVKSHIVPLNVSWPQVRDEYGNILSRLCAPSKKNYSDFSSLSSKQQVRLHC